MGRRGPAPTPTPILRLRGSKRVTKKRERSEARGPAGRPDSPDWLDEDALRMWEHLVPLLEAMGVLTRIDGNALARYCRVWVRWRKADAFIKEKGEMYPVRGDDGQVKRLRPFPQVSIAHQLTRELTRLEQEFGMTPSARARIQLTPENQETRHGKKRFFTAS